MFYVSLTTQQPLHQGKQAITQAIGGFGGLFLSKTLINVANSSFTQISNASMWPHPLCVTYDCLQCNTELRHFYPVLCWAVLGWARLGWVGLGWTGLLFYNFRSDSVLIKH